MNRFAARKKLLAAESEVYRQLLKMEMETFKVYAVRTKRRFTSLNSLLPLLMSSVPLAAGMFGKKRRFSLKKIFSLLFFGWKTYQRFSPMFRSGFSGKPGASQTAAEEYLSKRL